MLTPLDLPKKIRFNAPMQIEKQYFLNVKNSANNKSWVDRLDLEGARLAKAISQTTGISEIVARILAGRGVGQEEAEIFLNPTLRDLMPDPSILTDMDNLSARIAKAIINKEKIALFGDYDVDGACSVALLQRFLAHFDIETIVHIPDRIFEGYGPNDAAMDSFIKQGVSLIITLDCGTSSIAPITYAKSLGADVLVIDHHLAKDELPPANAIVNPNRLDDISDLGYLCAAGVCFMVLVALNRQLRSHNIEDLPDLMQMIDLVALATICDVVPLMGLNRAFVMRGVELMRNGANIGIKALALSAKITQPINAYHLGFIIGPRINAGGRIGDASLGVRLLASNDEQEVSEIATRLNELNIERQMIEAEALEEAILAASAEIGEGEGPPVLVLASKNWHQGVVGLVASRLKEKFNRPAFAISLAMPNKATGSGRSIAGVDLGSAVIKAVESGIIAKGGGHAMAAGISLLPDELGAFRSFIESELEQQVKQARSKNTLKIDAAITARTASLDFVHLLEKAGPYGAGNAIPIFAFPAHRIKYAKIVGKGGHIRFNLYAGDGANIEGIAFRAADTEFGQILLDARDNKPIHIAGSLGINHWQGREKVQLRAIDASIA